MKCICGKELIGKQKYCSTACRMKASRSRSVTEEGASVTGEVPSVTELPSVTSSVTHPDRDNIYSPHYDTSEEGFRRRNKAWDDASRFQGTPAQQEAARKVNRMVIMADNIRINREHVANAVSEAARREKQEAAMEAIRKLEG